MSAYLSFKDIPKSPLSMAEAVAAMDALHRESYARYSWSHLRFLLSKISRGHFSPSIEDTPAAPMIRGRAVLIKPVGKTAHVDSTRLFTNLSDLGPPPSECVSTYGRCHVPRSPLFYASFDESTVLAELAPERDSLVYLINCVPNDGALFKTRLIGEIDYIRRFRRSSVLSHHHVTTKEILEWIDSANDEQDYVRLLTDAFFAEMFSRNAVTQNDYRASSALCSLMLELKGTDEPSDGEALYYPSVAHRGGMNIALTPKCFHEKARVVSCKVIKVDACFGFGLYKTHVVANGEMDSDGGIQWRTPDQNRVRNNA